MAITFVALRVIITILSATRLMLDLFRGSLIFYLITDTHHLGYRGTALFHLLQRV